MAEATKTLSLEREATYEQGDQLWMGHSVIPRDVACCETTVNLPSFPAFADTKGDISKSAFVVNDLTQHPDLSTRPYVAGYPHARFYAGVPITTSSGLNIGAYCILDDKVRDGVSRKDLLFLGDMSQTVMTHLESVRALSEQQKSNRMVNGLKDFVRGSLDAGHKVQPATNMPLKDESDTIRKSRTVQYRLPDALIDPILTPAITPLRSAEAGYFAHETQANQPASSPECHGTEVPVTQQPADVLQTLETKPDVRVALISPAAWASKSRQQEKVRKHGETVKVESLYQRAAESLCRSLDIDGVAFLDASVRDFGGLSEAANTDSTEGTSGESDDSTNIHPVLQSDGSADERPTTDGRPCKLLGCAQTLSEDRSGLDSAQLEPAHRLTDHFLHGLVRRNPHGKIWTFDEHFKAYFEDGFSSDDSGYAGKDSGSLTPTTKSRKAARRQKRSDGDILQSAFPGCRSIAVYGVWDFTRKRWSVVGLYWSFDPLTHITRETEMPFVTAFCDIVVAESKRREVMGSDKAKSDFISSVSHELRSPLHGILGSCEMLSEQSLGSPISSLVEQIDSCGHTLLEIIDHLLDFANLKSQRLKKGAVKSSRIGQTLLPSPEITSADDLKALNRSVLLDDLTEDAVVAAVYSFYYSQGFDERTHVPVILDIDRFAGEDWHCGLATGGWKRVCINLVNNALKYTPSGFVKVSLTQRSRSGLRQRFYAVLTITDSGKGMSKAFQTDHLFRSFSQEDTLSDGLGLGLHMCSRIIYAMGGKIEVSSSQDGTGTCITVRVPLEHKRDSQDHAKPSIESSVSSREHLSDVRIGLVAGTQAPLNTHEDALIASASVMVADSIRKNATYLGAQVEQCKWEDNEPYDLKIITEVQLAGILSGIREQTTPLPHRAPSGSAPTALLVICNTTLSAQKFQDEWRMDCLRLHLSVEHISLPCGIRQFSGAILTALNRHRERKLLKVKSHDQQQEPEVKDSTTADATLRSTTHSVATESTSSALMDSPHPSPVAYLPESASTTPLEDARGSTEQRWPTGTRLTDLPRSRASTSLGRLHKQPTEAYEGMPSPSTTHPAPAVSPVGRGTFLLLVDDNDVNLKILTMFAKKHKHPYVTAVDGRLAVEAFVEAHKASSTPSDLTATETAAVRNGLPIVILMDINMPVMDGYEATQRIRAYEKEHHLIAAKIVAVTALQSDAAQIEAFGSGFDLFLSKPIKLKNLAKLIEAW